MLKALAEPFHIENHALHISGSIGLSLYPTDGEDEHTLMRNADAAMYHAKEKGRSNCQFFSADADTI
ncbi:diguanylate cyclase [Noviherbaspirillum saxi]|uniref:Diguanylate cyclase n=1 Tax=Noviherbaspirillum saxi TaxID=2320863 RepID=A0A3A3FFH6_9BURK|nr:diguanylate cyclase [Noviherbaspirillum saxi]